MSADAIPRYVSDTEAARVLGVAVGTLRNWRWRCEGPAYVKRGRMVRYALTDLVAWAEAGRVKTREMVR